MKLGIIWMRKHGWRNMQHYHKETLSGKHLG
jgi:hypothetical protein